KNPTLGICRELPALPRPDNIRITLWRRAAVPSDPDPPALLFQMVGHHLRDHVAGLAAHEVEASHAAPQMCAEPQMTFFRPQIFKSLDCHLDLFPFSPMLFGRVRSSRYRLDLPIDQ